MVDWSTTAIAPEMRSLNPGVFMRKIASSHEGHWENPLLVRTTGAKHTVLEDPSHPFDLGGKL